MLLNAAGAAVTTIVSALLAFLPGKKALTRRSLAQWWWTAAFTLSAFAALLQLVSFARGSWSPAVTYRLYLIFAAMVPGVMGTGSLYLLARRSLAHLFAALICLLSVLGVVAAFTATLHPAILGQPFPAATEVAKATPSVLVTITFAAQGSLGALAMIVAALVSIWRQHSKNALCILIGALFFSAAGSLAALGNPDLFLLDQAVGICFLYAGAAMRFTKVASPAPASTVEPSQP